MPHKKVVQALRNEVKKVFGSFIGMVCGRYSTLGRIFIFRIAALPNHENRPVDHDHVCFVVAGESFLEYKFVSLEGSWIPTYWIASRFHLNGKLDWH